MYTSLAPVEPSAHLSAPFFFISSKERSAPRLSPDIRRFLQPFPPLEDFIFQSGEPPEDKTSPAAVLSL